MGDCVELRVDKTSTGYAFSARAPGPALHKWGRIPVGLVLLVLLLALLFGGLGFAVHALWIVAVVLFVAWVLGFVVRGAEGSRWYRW
jgi:hypothetical protein